MSKVLIIRHLPTALSFADKEQLLKHFGAVKVWETSSKRNYIFAAFPTEEHAKASLTRLHQLEIAHRRLTVEYSFEKEPLLKVKDDNEDSSTASKHVKHFLHVLNAWNPSVNFYQPPPINVKYKYPEVTPLTLINIINELSNNRAFYTQTLHLMNKMCLETPFEENCDAINTFKNTFRQYFVQEIALPLESEEGSEMSSDECQHEKQIVPSLVKRKHTLPKTRKRPAALLSTATLPKAKKKPVNQDEVFESSSIPETKKISLKVNQDALQKPADIEVEVVGELGKFEKEAQPLTQEETPAVEQRPAITRKELLQNRISYSDMKMLPVFKNYHPGPPSMRLYIKNLAKTVTEQDVSCIYRGYIENLSEDKQIGFDVRVMTEGRMKGQAFVTFPSVQLAGKALNETNGFILKEKPMVVQFARAANKKSID